MSKDNTHAPQENTHELSLSHIKKIQMCGPVIQNTVTFGFNQLFKNDFSLFSILAFKSKM